MTSKQNKSSNFELIRIIAMSFVVISHYAQHGLLPFIESKSPIVQFLAMYLHTLGALGVTLFVLLTGYFMIDKNSNIKHFFSIAIETVFYSYVILIILALFFNNGIVFTPRKIYLSVLPILKSQYWFVTAYLLLYLAIPPLNKLFNVLDKQTVSKYLLLFFVIWFVIPLLGYKIKLFGSPFTNFVCLYYIGAYIKRWGLPFFEKKRNAFIILFLAQGIICLWQLIFLVLHHFDEAWFMHIVHNSTLTVLSAISIFALMKNVKIGQNSVINYFSSSAFAVYLITENIFMRDIIWTNIFHCNNYPNLSYLIWNMPLALIISYLVCTLIDKIRIKLFENCMLNFVQNLYDKTCSYIKLL